MESNVISWWLFVLQQQKQQETKSVTIDGSEHTESNLLNLVHVYFH
jgi:hypothetical protein